MFCTSLRRRKQWAAAVPHLVQHDKLKFRGMYGRERMPAECLCAY